MIASNRKISLLFTTAAWLSALEAVVAAIYLLTIPSDPKNAFLFSLSIQRLVLVSVFLLLLVLFAAAGWMSIKSFSWLSSVLAQKPGKRFFNIALSVLFVLFLAAWIFTFIPSYRLGEHSAYFERLHPLIVWAMLASLQHFFFFSIWRWDFRYTILLNELRSNKTIWITAIVSFLICCALLGVILITGWGLIPDQMLWNEIGVPVLGIQVIASFLLGLVVTILFAKLADIHKALHHLLITRPRRIDICIAFLVWLTAVLLWALVPQVKNFFAPGPYPPNEVFYPYSDAALYDTSAQLALIGEGLNGGAYVDKPLYSAFLVLLNFIADENFNWVVTLQVMALAFLPVTAYWLGKSFHSRGLGLGLALMIIFKQYNAISATVWISTSTSRILMSEVPVSLFIALITLWSFKWLKNRGSRPWETVVVGGLLGLSTLIRHNMWAFLPALVLISLVVFGIKSFRKWLWNSALLILMIVVSIVPWSIRLQIYGGQPFGLLIPLLGTVWENRYLPSIEEEVIPPTASETIEPSFSETVSPDVSLPDISLPDTSLPDASLSISEPQPSYLNSLSEPARTHLPARTATVLQPKTASGQMGQVIISHFFHNIVTSVLELPHHLALHDLETLTTMPGTHWDRNWQGQLHPGSWVLILLNLALVSLGIGAAVKQWGAVGLLPLGIYFTYLASNSIARTSGGRYLVPFDWLLFLYFLAGCFQAAFWLMQFFGFSFSSTVEAAPMPKEKHPLIKCLLIGLAFLAVGALVPISEMVEPQRYTESREEIMTSIIENNFPLPGIDSEGLIEFSAQPQSIILEGRALYPRFYFGGQGEPGYIVPLQAKEYPRLTFGFITSGLSTHVILPIKDSPQVFPHSSDVTVLGCADQGDWINAYVVIIHGETETVILRHPEAELTCPLPEPVLGY